MYTVEPIFGNLKENTGIKTFLLRGIAKVKGEFNLMAIGHNLKKISNFINKNDIGIAEAMQKIQEIGIKRQREKLEEEGFSFVQRGRKHIRHLVMDYEKYLV